MDPITISIKNNVATISNNDAPDAKEDLRAFLEKREPKFNHGP